MPRRCWVYINGIAYEKGVDLLPDSSGTAPMVFGDIPDFVSTIDGSVVRGRAGLRDHCARHGVVPMQEVQGLPPKPAVKPYELPTREREQTKRTMHQIADQRGYFRNN